MDDNDVVGFFGQLFGDNAERQKKRTYQNEYTRQIDKRTVYRKYEKVKTRRIKMIELLTTEEVADLFEVQETTVRVWVCREKFPKEVMFKLQDVKQPAWSFNNLFIIGLRN